MNGIRVSRRADSGFLSCLLGSELWQAALAAQSDFLSCLLGSEHGGRQIDEIAVFLSCLLGSERIPAFRVQTGSVSELPTRQ